MASQSYIQLTKGAEPSAATVATDATSLGAAGRVRVIIASDLTRDEAAAMLSDIRLQVLDTRRDWTLAST